MRARSDLPNDLAWSNRPRSARLKLIVAYDGAPFRGWQSQSSGNTIQDHLESCFFQITGQKVRVHGAGRTDAGVHALGQCAHVDVPATKMQPPEWSTALNALLPPQIRVLRCQFAPRNFHARFSARGKIYRYRISTTPVLAPFELRRAWHVTGSLNDDAMRGCARIFIGTHDFAGFGANRGKPETSTMRTIRAVNVRRSPSLTVMDFDGDGFLYKMVRLMVGAIVRCGWGKITVDEVRAQLLASISRGDRLVAPADGLILVSVRY